MADELLVSTVRYKGVNVGTASITVEDTSSLSNYDFRLTNADTGAVTDPTGLRQLNEYILRVTDQTPRGESKYIYLRWTAPDGKFLSDGSSNTGVAKTVTESLSIPTDGVANIRFKNNFFPSATGYTGKLELHHDANRTLLIRTFNFSVQMVATPYIRIIPERNANNGTSYPPTVKMGERFIVRIDAIGDDVLPKTQTAKYSGTVAGQPLNSNGYISPVSELAIGVYKSDALAHYGGWQTLQSNIQSLGTPDQVISVQMGEVVSQNNLFNVGAVNAGPYTSVTAPVNIDLLHRGGVFTDYAYFFGQGMHTSIYKSGFLSNVTFNASQGTNVSIGAYVPAITDSDPAVINKAWSGALAALAFKPADLTTLDSRRQFGKFQKVVTRHYDKDTAWVRTYEWKDITDTISDAQYGVISDFKSSNLVILPQPMARAEVARIWMATNTKINIEVAWTPLSGGGSTYYTGDVNVLFLRESELLENHQLGTPYPRIIKAGRQLINDGTCVITIPNTSTINLNESRYVVQHAIETGSDSYSISNDTTVTTTAKSVTIKSKPTGSNTYWRHYAIWDLGPGLVQFPDK